MTLTGLKAPSKVWLVIMFCCQLSHTAEFSSYIRGIPPAIATHRHHPATIHVSPMPYAILLYCHLMGKPVHYKPILSLIMQSHDSEWSLHVKLPRSLHSFWKCTLNIGNASLSGEGSYSRYLADC